MICLYGVVEAEHEVPDVPAIGGAKLQLVTSSSLGVLYSELADGQELTADDANEFLDVLLAALDTGIVLPLALGTVMPDVPTARDDFLAAQSEHLLEQIDRLRDVVEVHVDADDDESVAVAQLAGQQGIRLAPDADFPERMAVGEQVANLLVEQRRRMAEEIVAALDNICVASVPRSSIGGPDDPVLRWSFLVPRDQLAVFDDAHKQLQRHYPMLSIRTVGPLPPVNFLAPPSQTPVEPAEQAGASGSWGW